MYKTEEEISELVEKYADTVFRLAFSYTKNRSDAEDIVQEVFIRLVERGKSFKSAEHEKAWLLRVAVNLAKDTVKNYWRRNTQGFSETDAVAVSDEYFHDDIVLEAVMSLDALSRTAIHLYYYEGYKTPEISKMLGKRESSVRSILYRAREKLKTILKEEYDFE